ncbi:MAG: TIGR03790 family protein, partial [Verrucomicrobiota bacterium]
DSALAADALPFTKRAEFRTNQSAVDSELSLIAAGTYLINAFVPNPLFQNNAPTEHEKSQIVKVSRLDAPTFDAANALVDQALAAERTGLLGRAYVDIGGIHASGDRWLNSTATQIEDLGFDLTVDRDPATLPATARIDAPALYFGWYAGNLNGPFTSPDFRFPPGAIALHIHSYSAHTLRSPTAGWVGPLLARGVTATLGNVSEPYLELTHQPQLFMKALARGATLVDAAYYALPALSWQAILIGDPLYRPFVVSLDDQINHLATLPPRLAGYAVLRRMRQLEAAHQPTEALALASKTQGIAPSLAVGYALASRLYAA